MPHQSMGGSGTPSHLMPSAERRNPPGPVAYPYQSVPPSLATGTTAMQSNRLDRAYQRASGYRSRSVPA